MNILINKLKEKRASGAVYVLICVLVLVFSVLLIFSLYFVAGLSHIRIQMQEAQTVLDSYVADNAVNIYAALKGESNLGAVLVDDVFLAELTGFSKLTQDTVDGETVYVCYTDPDAGVWSYYITAPTLSFSGKDTAAKMHLDYTITIPIRLSQSSQASVVSTDITLSSDLNLNDE